MSKNCCPKRYCKCCCQPCPKTKSVAEEKVYVDCNCCGESNNGGYEDGILGIGSGIAPIIFLLIACGSGLLACNSSYLIILLFLLCGGDSVSNLFGSC